MMVARIDMAGTADAARHPHPGARRRYRLRDLLTGDEYDVGGAELARIIGVEIGYIDWVIAEDGAFENGRWRVR